MRHEALLTGRGQRLKGRLWSGDLESKGVVVVVHGLGDHAGRYASLAESLVALNWSVLVFDLPGHGESPGSRGKVDSFDGMLDDIAEANRAMRERFSSRPQVLLGHSMGGNLALNFLLRRRELDEALDVSGLVLCAPMLLPPQPPPRPHIFAAWLTGHVLPWVTVDRPVDPTKLTSDPEQAEAIEADPQMHSRITAYLATQLLSQGRYALDHAREVDRPTLIMYGEDDELIDHGACENLAIRIGQNATTVPWAGQRHDLFHDVGRNEVFARIGDWLNSL